MRKLTTALLLMAAAAIHAQGTATGPTYYLPKTAVRLTLQIEKTSYTPGDYAQYADRYLKRSDVSTQPTDDYRLLNVKMQAVGLPDKEKMFTAVVDGKNNVRDIRIDDNGVLTAVNAEPKAVAQQERFQPAPKPLPINPRDYMSEEILTAGSTAKMAELSAIEIFDIRESRNMLTRGQAEFMPHDGTQMRLMLDKLDLQEQALLQLFTGVTVTDTLEQTLTFVPTAETQRQLLFRFSKKLGLCEADDLAGRPYYVSVEDLHVIPNAVGTPLDDPKKDKEDPGICVNLPGKIRLSLFDGEKQWAQFDIFAAQFGRVERMGSVMFNKKVLTHLVLNPVTGNVESLQAEAVK